MEFTDWYKKVIDDSQVDPPEAIWNSISDELDINASWKVIDKRLSWNSFIIRSKKIALFSTAAVFLIFFGYFSIFKIVNHERVAKPLNSASNFGIDQKKVFISELILRKVLKDGKNNNNLPVLNNMQTPNNRVFDKVDPLDKEVFGFYIPIPETSNIITSESFLQAGNVNLSNEPGNENRHLDSSSFSKLHRFALHVAALNSTGDNAELGYKKNYILLPKGISFGGTIGANNTWLLNDDTYNGLRKNELNMAIPFYDRTLGVVAGWNISDKLGIEIKMNFINNIGQKYKEYRQGKYVPREIIVNYSTHSVLLSYKQPFYLTPEILSSRNILFGLNYGHMKSAAQDLNGKKEEISNFYNNKNLSVVLGYQYDMYVFDNFIITTGIDLNYGLLNIWKGSDKFPSNFNDTRTGSIGVLISARYFIPFRIK